MIYVFRGLARCCDAPCRFCGEACKVLARGCEHVSVCFQPIVDAPLGRYVIGTWFVMFFVALCGGLGFISAECDDSTIACAVFIALAALHASFAYYLQRRIVVGMTKRGQQTVNQQELAREAGRIMLYDIGVCLYSILYVCAWCWCFYSFAMLGCGGGAGFAAAILLILYGMAASTYLLAWYCCTCCAGTAGEVWVLGEGRPAAVPRWQQQLPLHQPRAIVGSPILVRPK